MLKKICEHCGRTINQGTACPCGMNRHKLYDETRRDKAKSAFYKSTTWRRVAEYTKARANGLDEYLLAEGRLCKGNTAHHIYTVDERPDLKLSLDNLIYLSGSTHNMVHNEYDKGKETRQAMQRKLLTIRGRQKA